jgi:hypothetical protein
MGLTVGSGREHNSIWFGIESSEDVHHPWQLQFIEPDLAAALKARILSHQIINFMSISDLRNWVKQTRQHS